SSDLDAHWGNPATAACNGGPLHTEAASVLAQSTASQAPVWFILAQLRSGPATGCTRPPGHPGAPAGPLAPHQLAYTPDAVDSSQAPGKAPELQTHCPSVT